ncbi:efflux RND transporter periplasmic adaptor subunit [Variovorax ginsengisoli]|uniref:Efflux RND transporter periplasmic adaptor subunit n=1 Tax=Variovorax ginsengisoli TaxID=363844 RepID=A0ABT8S1W5_9BURK|nr:efflux RND transporter periplasmic adaptor subunit [Variovorax ginsengisoli]MDN8613650.1 efflux RND transporter periplasmic adaptor subunit [Variovorax ginsengisoli]MDO1532820.1 efflux RND transporter periplasmic adaptor subunit [Variovorax ginsengisoli]
MKNSLSVAGALAVAALLSACSPDKPQTEAPRPVRTADVRYDAAREANRYAGTVQSRYEVDQAFRVGGKVAQRKVDVGQIVHEGDILAVLDDSDYRLAEEAARQQWSAAVAQARQAESDRKRLGSLKADGSVSVADDERSHSGAETAQAAEGAQARQLELARNRLKYTVLRASRSGVVTAVRIEVGQVVAEGLPVVAIADPGTPEIVIDVPEDQVAAFKSAHFKASLASAPAESFEVSLREVSPQASAQTRTYRARLKPINARPLPLGATATLVTDRVVSDVQSAAIPATALTQANGHPAVWMVKRAGQEPVGTVDLMPVAVLGYRNDLALVSGLPAGGLVVTAGVQKMAPGLKVALADAALAEAKIKPADTTQQAVQ